jgi:hypothetical protein
MGDRDEERPSADKPISLSPLSLDDALDGLLRANPQRGELEAAPQGKPHGGSDSGGKPRPKGARRDRAGS